MPVTIEGLRERTEYIDIFFSAHHSIRFCFRYTIYRCLNGLAPSYLASDLQRVADLDARRRLRSASTSTLVVPVTCLSTVGDSAFPVAAARVWNSLPADVTSSPSLPTFQRRLKTELFARSYSAPAASDALFFTVRAARTSFRFCFCLFSSVRCPSSLRHYATLITFVQ